MKAPAVLTFITAFGVALSAPQLFAEEELANDIPYEWAPWKDPNNPNVIILSDDKDKFFERRETSKDPKREAGLVNPQR